MAENGLYDVLRMGLSSLRAQSRAIETVGRNMANVNNPTYSRQRVIFGDVSPTGSASVGVDVIEVQQVRDVLLDRQLVREKSGAAALEAETAAYERGEAAMGETISSVSDPSLAATTGSNSLTNAMAGFFGAARQLSVDPTNSTQKQMFVQTAKTMTERFQFSNDRLAEVQADLTNQVSNDVDKANGLLTTIKELNLMIATQESKTGTKALTLRDQRQARVEDLAQVMNFKTTTLPDAPNQIQITATSASGVDTVILSGGTTLETLAFAGAALRVVSSNTALTLTGGSTKGHLTARDGALQTLRNSLNLLAKQMVTSVNAAYNPSGTGQNFFDPAGTNASSIQLASGLTGLNVRASVAGGAAGDSSVAQAISKLDIRSFSSTSGDAINGTMGESYSAAISLFSYSLSQSRMNHENQTGVLNIVRGQRESTSGVSLDEEAAELMKFQRAYQASARVISVVDQMLDIVVNSLGRG
ncbi:MAG: flagellar hook-associated protein FlgK [Verrucomicrobiota bacterium]|jgi:flagellar hook-associated protein 1 FlgK